MIPSGKPKKIMESASKGGYKSPSSGGMGNIHDPYNAKGKKSHKSKGSSHNTHSGY